MKRPHRKYRIGLRVSVGDDGTQWIDMYLMRHRTCLFGHSFCLEDNSEGTNRRRFAIVWRGLRREAKLEAVKANRKKNRNANAPRPHP